MSARDSMVCMESSLSELILEHLRALRAAADRVEVGLGELRLRTSSLETQVATIHGDMALVHARLDKVTDRLDLIERRLELVSG